MSETPTNVTPPPDLTYGYVDGRIILAIGDRSDAGRMPDPVPADDTTVTLTPANTILKVTTPTPATVIKQPIVCAVDANGYLVDGQGARGVWLVTGTYKVTYSHSRAIIPSHDIEVTTGHTEVAPLDLTTAMPPGGPVLAPSEYAELNGRLTILEAGGGAVDSVNGEVGAVVLDAADVGADPAGTAAGLVGALVIPDSPDDIGAATAAQGAKADTAVQPGDLVVNVRDFGAVGDGVADDTAAIQAAIAAMVPGSTIYFPQGRYMTDGGHIISQPSTTVLGASGRAQTYNSSAQLYLRNNANAHMLTIAANQVTVRSLSLYGNANNQSGAVGTSHGLVTPNTSGANYLLLDAVWVDTFNGDGYSFESSGGTLSATMVNCESRKNYGYGMRFYDTSTDFIVSNSYVDQNRQSGIYCAAGDIAINDCHIWGNGTGASGDRDGITFVSASGCRVHGTYIESQTSGVGIRFKSGTNRGHSVLGCDIWNNGTQGIYAFQLSQSIISSNVIRHNNFSGLSGVSGAGLAVDSCSALTVVGNQFFSTVPLRQTWGYFEIGAANVDIRFAHNTARAADHVTGGVSLGVGTLADLSGVSLVASVAPGPLWYNLAPGANGTYADVPGQKFLHPYWLPTSATLDQIAINVTTGSAGSLTRLAIYTLDTGGASFTLLHDLGTVDSSSPGVKTITGWWPLPAGTFWLAHKCEVAGCTYTTSTTIAAPGPLPILGGPDVAQFGKSLHGVRETASVDGAAYPATLSSFLDWGAIGTHHRPALVGRFA